MSVTTKSMSAEELFAMPKGGFRYELIRGELIQMAPAGQEHGKLTMRLGWRLAQYVEAHGLGVVYSAETGFKLETSPDTVRAPDVAFLSNESLERIGEGKSYAQGVPDLVAEVISPNDLYNEVEDKVSMWLEYGTRMVIVLNPRLRSVTVYRPDSIVRLTAGEMLEAADVVPGWRVPVAELFGVKL